MSRKAKLSNALRNIGTEWKNADSKIMEIYKTDGWTPEFKEEKAQEVRMDLNLRVNTEKQVIISVIDEKLDSMFKVGASAFDAAYQSRLTNVLNIVTLAGNEIDLRDLKSMIEPFNNDYTALQAIRAAITNAGIDQKEDYPRIMSSLATGSLEARKETHRLLVKFKKSISAFDIARSNGNISWTQGMEYLGYDAFLDDFNDNLDYIKEIAINGPTDIENAIE